MKNKIQHYKCLLADFLDQKKKMEEDKKVDEASLESMDASDPPAHISKSTEDKVLH
ncbi:MAG: hypothetical protein V4598_07770 [Bdellovibrionota bacterium]